MERWKPIPECCGRYEVSDLGHVRNVNTGQVLKPRKTRTGYHRIHVSVKGGRIDLYIHRLVADAFCEHPEGCDVVNHLDCNNQNNKASNLEWTTQEDNVLYAMDRGRMPNFPNCIPVIGEKNGSEFWFRSANEAARKVGCDSRSISKCCKSKHKHSHGYTWRYAEVAV